MLRNLLLSLGLIINFADADKTFDISFSKQSNSFDLQLGVLDDLNEYIRAKFDQIRDDVTLIPDTAINEVVMIHEDCEMCFS